MTHKKYEGKARARLRSKGTIHVRLTDELGYVKYDEVFDNLITQVGDQFYMDRAAGIGSIDAVTGMKLGDSTTTPTKTGGGATLGNYISGSNKAIDGGYPTTALSGSARRITWRTTWDPGEGTDDAIAEVVLTNQDPLADDSGSAGVTIARALISPTVDKQAGDTLTITWLHDGEGV